MTSLLESPGRRERQRKGRARWFIPVIPPKAPRKQPASSSTASAVYKVNKRKSSSKKTISRPPAKTPAMKPRDLLQPKRHNLLPPPASQLAANAQEEHIFIDVDENEVEETVDPTPEELVTIPEAEIKACLKLVFMSRWRVFLDKQAVMAAFNTKRMNYVDMSEPVIWRWVDSVTEEQPGQYKHLTATVYFSGQVKDNRWVQVLRRDQSSTYLELKDLISQLPTSWPGKSYCVDFDLFLAPIQPASVLQANTSSESVRGRLTATRIQEGGLQSVWLRI